MCIYLKSYEKWVPKCYIYSYKYSFHENNIKQTEKSKFNGFKNYLEFPSEYKNCYLKNMRRNIWQYIEWSKKYIYKPIGMPWDSREMLLVNLGYLQKGNSNQ